MRVAVEHLLRVPDQALEVDGQLHAGIPCAHDLCAQRLQICFQLHKDTHTHKCVGIQS